MQQCVRSRGGGRAGTSGRKASAAVAAGQAPLWVRASHAVTGPIALLHPGAMGAVVGAALRGCGATVLWVDAGRSPETAARAEHARLRAAGSLDEALVEASAVLSVCPPHAAIAVAEAVAARRFGGIYVDANAVAPATAERVAAVVEGAGATYVDGGIVGPPPVRPGTTRLYLSGAGGEEVRSWFPDGPLEAIYLGPQPSAASALKVCYAAGTKGVSALMLAVRAVAAAFSVEDDLMAEWRLSQPEFIRRFDHAVETAPKAWRFEGEMLEIAAAFRSAGLPGGFHEAAAAVFSSLDALKDVRDPDWPTIAPALLPEP